MSKKQRKWAILLFVLFCVLLGLHYWTRTWVLESIKDPATSVLERLNSNLEMKMIKKLAEYESGLKIDAIHRNDGGSDSIGLLQWKVSSFTMYALKYNLFPNAEAKEIENFVADPNAQIDLTVKVLAESGGWRNWTNYFKSIGY